MYERNKKKQKSGMGLHVAKSTSSTDPIVVWHFLRTGKPGKPGKSSPPNPPDSLKESVSLLPSRMQILSRVGGVDGDVSAGVAFAS